MCAAMFGGEEYRVVRRSARATTFTGEPRPLAPREDQVLGGTARVRAAPAPLASNQSVDGHPKREHRPLRDSGGGPLQPIARPPCGGEPLPNGSVPMEPDDRGQDRKRPPQGHESSACPEGTAPAGIQHLPRETGIDRHPVEGCPQVTRVPGLLEGATMALEYLRDLGRLQPAEVTGILVRE